MFLCQKQLAGPVKQTFIIVSGLIQASAHSDGYSVGKRAGCLDSQQAGPYLTASLIYKILILCKRHIDNEFISVYTAQNIMFKGHEAQDLDDLLNDKIPGNVAVSVIDLLEMVYVKHEKDAGPFFCQHPG